MTKVQEARIKHSEAQGNMEYAELMLRQAKQNLSEALMDEKQNGLKPQVEAETTESESDRTVKDKNKEG